MQTRNKVGVLFLAIVVLLFVRHSDAQSPPSGIAQRVLIAVQNPSGNSQGATVIVPQFALQIANAATDSYVTPGLPNNSTPRLFSGWTSEVPADLENLSGERYGLVSNEDGSASILNYSTESVVTPEVGINTISSGALLTQDLRYVLVANQQAGQLSVLDRQSSNPPVILDLPGVRNISTSPSATVIMAFAQDDSTAYYLRQLGQANQTAYAFGAWPANAKDCEPYNLPTFCLMEVASAGSSPTAYSQAYFDHPVKAVASATSGLMYILNGGPEADGTHAGVTALPIASILLADGTPPTAIPPVPAYYDIQKLGGGAMDAISIGSTLYVVGQGQIHPGEWSGQLTTINTETGAVSVPTTIADGEPVRMALGDDNTLWIGSIRCNRGHNFLTNQTQAANKPNYGCLTVVNTDNHSAWVEPWSCPVDTGTPCAVGDTPSNYIWSGGGSGDVTGIAPIIGLHKVYYIEHGQVHIRQTLSPYNIIPNNGVTVAGIAVDAVYIDQASDNDGTYTSTKH